MPEKKAAAKKKVVAKEASRKDALTAPAAKKMDEKKKTGRPAKSAPGREEKQFFDTLRNVFIGAEIEGEGGFVNLMRIKSRYFEKGVFPQLKTDVDEALTDIPEFRAELFDKLYTFFKRYFSESGSIYFRHTPIHQQVYDKVYTDDRDVILFWKTHMLYYVKTDRLYHNLDVDLDDHVFSFDVSELENKQTNERRALVFTFKKKDTKDKLVFGVTYSSQGRKTKFDDIRRELREVDVTLSEDTLKHALDVFEKQSEVDYFINKDASAFLREQFQLWLYQYVFAGESDWTERRINELQILKAIAFKIIDFIGQFEDELVRVWEKPKFVLNSNYVVTLDRLTDKKGGIELVRRILLHKGMKNQVAEWQEMGIVGDGFELKQVVPKTGADIAETWKHLPIDTKYFKDLELQILALFDHLDNSLDGWLIKSENWQALNTLLPKLRGAVQTVYIDPPFKTGDDFLYRDRFRDSSWLELMHGRLSTSQDMIKESGTIFLHLDWNADFYGRILLDSLFGPENFLNEIIWRIGWVSGYKTQAERFVRNHDTLYFFAQDKSKAYVDKDSAVIPYRSFDIKNISDELSSIMAKWGLEAGSITNKKVVFKTSDGLVVKDGLKDNDGKYYMEDTWNCNEYEELHSNKIKRNAKEYTPNGSQITQKPEQLLERIINVATHKEDILLDFFLGSATSTAVAHKLGRRWIGIEMAGYFETDALYRMKHVLAGATSREPCGISKRVGWSGGGFFKYYQFEQYEDALRHATYEDGDLFNDPYHSPYQQYVFLADPKMLKAWEVDTKKGSVDVDLSKLYDGIDIAETLANLKGKRIKRIAEDCVEFDDGEIVSYSDPTFYEVIKPLVWW